MNKVVVCITIHQNSKRLIQNVFELAQTVDGERDVIHIRKGETIFDTPNSTSLFEELFVYGSELGGEVHFLCSSNVTQTISDFISNNAISHVILGKPPTTATVQTNVYGALQESLKNCSVVVVDREDIQA